MHKKIAIFLVGGFLFLSFIIFSYFVNKDVFTHIDFDTTVRLQDKIPRRVDTMFSFFSEVGSFEVSFVVLFLLIGVLVWKKKLIAAFLVFTFFGFFHLIELFGKRFVDHFPPPQFMLRTEDQVAFPQFHIREENSYPSGHSGRAAFFTALIAFMVLYSKKLSMTQKVIILSILAIYTLTMFVSRIYLGEHWMTDVVGGAILGIAFAFLAAISL
ncbi:MAG: phosphatase PAP2 family protein [Candidatus Levybacteria bacterium]|nr:phosphatase PAP2 family protein [Candidatus Levybacteria bacterium]